MKRKAYTFHVNPGHAWLEVPTADVMRAGIFLAVSEYSYLSRDGQTSYLEEDCDTLKFLHAAGIPVSDQTILEKMYENDCWIRALPSFPPRAVREECMT